MSLFGAVITPSLYQYRNLSLRSQNVYNQIPLEDIIRIPTIHNISISINGSIVHHHRHHHHLPIIFLVELENQRFVYN